MQVEFIAKRRFVLNGQPVAPDDRVDVATLPNPVVRALAGTRKLGLRIDGRPATPGEMALLLHPPGRAGQLSQPPAANARTVPTLEPAPQPAPAGAAQAEAQGEVAEAATSPGDGRRRRASRPRTGASPAGGKEPLSTAPSTAPAGPKPGSTLESLARSERRRRQKARTRQAAALADALFTPRSRAERARALVAALPSFDPPEGTPS